MIKFGDEWQCEADPKRVEVELLEERLWALTRFGSCGDSQESLAAHQVRCARLVQQLGGTPLEQLAALVHDVTELLTGDASGPFLDCTGQRDAFRALTHAAWPIVSVWLGFDADRAEKLADLLWSPTARSTRVKVADQFDASKSFDAMLGSVWTRHYVGRGDWAATFQDLLQQIRTTEGEEKEEATGETNF